MTARRRLAAFLGPDELPWNRFAARARIAETAQCAYAAFEPQDQRGIDAYAKCVNAWLHHGRIASPELAALAALPGALPRHEPWPVWMPLDIFLVTNTLASSFPNAFCRAHVQATAGAAYQRRFESNIALLAGVAPAAVPEVPSTALAGDRGAVCAMASIPGVTDGVLLGPVARWVWDLTDRERSR